MAYEKNLPLVQGQLDAYNKRDINTFCKYFHPEVEVFKLGQQEPLFIGMEKFKEVYHSRFEQNPDLLCELKSRVVLENSILDEEWVTGDVRQNKPIHVVAIYQFKDNLIFKVSFVF